MSIALSPLRSLVATSSGTSSAMKPTCASLSALYLKVTGSSPASAFIASSAGSERISFFSSRLEAFVQTPPTVTKAPAAVSIGWVGKAIPTPTLPAKKLLFALPL